MVRGGRLRRLEPLTAAAIVLVPPPTVFAQQRDGPPVVSQPAEASPRPSGLDCEGRNPRCPPPRTGQAHEVGGDGPVIIGGTTAAIGLGFLLHHYATEHPTSPPWDSEDKLDREGPRAWPRTDHPFPAAGDYDLDVVAFLPHGPWTMGFAPTPVQVR